MRFRTSNWLMPLLAMTSRNGRKYFAGTYEGGAPIVIEPGQRVLLVRSKPMAPDAPETWSLLAEEAPLPEETTSPQIRLQTALAAQEMALADPGAHVPNLLPDDDLEDLKRAVHEQSAFFKRRIAG